MAAVSSDRLFDKVLVANRGEIACRIMKTCKRLGIKTVAVYSTADSQAKFVRMADESVCIGPPPSLQSYLRIDAIVDACVRTKANAVHPGYGFLSEKPAFCSALKQAGVVFVGPDAESMDQVSDKIASKTLAAEAGVSTIPGFRGEITSHDQLLREANKIGYPVMVKASGGGGGRGMHIANNDKEAVEYFELCRAEAINAFNNGRMLVEKFVEKPRHIEIQVIADRHGNTLYLPERECSIQRRNQKVLEEAPSTFIDPVTRKAMGEQAAAFARKVNYVSAGTVEMMVDKNKGFYFLEMNTRLQVEHPITELITGLDLVEQMLRAAAGKRLSVTQSDVKINGWATEARVCAEDPTQKYFPTIGRLSSYVEPTGEGVRVDSGIIAGSQISVYYDSLIAKLCTWAPTRAESLTRLERALDEYVIRGLKNNVCLLRDVIREERYQSGDITTNYLPEQYPNGFVKAALTAAEAQALQVVAAALRMVRETRYHTLSPAHKATPTKTAAAKAIAAGHTDGANERVAEFGIIMGSAPDGAQTSVTLAYDLSRGAPATNFDSDTHHFRFAVGDSSATRNLTLKWGIDREIIIATVEGTAAPYIFQYFGSDEVSYRVQALGTVFTLTVLEAAERALYRHMPKVDNTVSLKRVVAPMPGVVVGVAVTVGQEVSAGDELVTLEAMKMRNKIRAEVAGVVKAVRVKEGDKLDDAALMVEFA
jgi:propionyl-CoA carboxylase alpha chain